MQCKKEETHLQSDWTERHHVDHITLHGHCKYFIFLHIADYNVIVFAQETSASPSRGSARSAVSIICVFLHHTSPNCFSFTSARFSAADRRHEGGEGVMSSQTCRHCEPALLLWCLRKVIFFFAWCKIGSTNAEMWANKWTWCRVAAGQMTDSQDKLLLLPRKKWKLFITGRDTNDQINQMKSWDLGKFPEINTNQF